MNEHRKPADESTGPSLLVKHTLRRGNINNKPCCDGVIDLSGQLIYRIIRDTCPHLIQEEGVIYYTDSVIRYSRGPIHEP